MLGVVGESGSGKSVTALPSSACFPNAPRSGVDPLRGDELVGRSERDLQAIRGREIAMVFQDALAALNPVMKVGKQIAEAITVHETGPADDVSTGSSLLDQVGIPDPEGRARRYPHEFSGGMRQRAMIAMAIANDPALLIADEPTTALDVTIQAQVLDVLERIRDRTGSSILFITHDLGFVAGSPNGRGHVRRTARRGGPGRRAPPNPATRTRKGCSPRCPASTGRARRHPVPDPGQLPSLVHRPAGCAFHPRCASVPFRPLRHRGSRRRHHRSRAPLAVTAPPTSTVSPRRPPGGGA